jgi:hypothetical protein
MSRFLRQPGVFILLICGNWPAEQWLDRADDGRARAEPADGDGV